MEDILSMNKTIQYPAFLRKHQTVHSLLLLFFVLWNSACWKIWATGFYDYLAFKHNDLIYYFIQAGIIFMLGLSCWNVEKRAAKILVCVAGLFQCVFWALHTVTRFSYGNYKVLIEKGYILPETAIWMRFVLLSNFFVGVFMIVIVFRITIGMARIWTGTDLH